MSTSRQRMEPIHEATADATSSDRPAPSGPRAQSRPPHHRRSQTIVAAGNLELARLQRHLAVQELHSELASTSRALEASQEEAQLAARIGQTLLQQNQEMGAEIRSKALELEHRADAAELEVQVLEGKLAAACGQIRALDVARARATVEAEQLTHALDDTRLTMTALRGELQRANAETERVEGSAKRLEDELETARRAIGALESTQRRLQEDIAVKTRRIEELEGGERYNLDHIARLEIENQSICQRYHVRDTREKQLLLDNDALLSRLNAQRHVLADAQAANARLEEMVTGLQGEVEGLREALQEEQHRVTHLTAINQDLEQRLDAQEQQRPQDETLLLQDEELDDESCRMLRTGSLFFELARQLKEDLRSGGMRFQARRSSLVASDNNDRPESPLPNEDTPRKVRPGASSPTYSTRTSRNPSSNASSDNSEDNNNSSAPTTEPSTPVSTKTPSHGHNQSARQQLLRRPPSLQLERRLSQLEDSVSIASRHLDTPSKEWLSSSSSSSSPSESSPEQDLSTRSSTTTVATTEGDEDNDESILKEFFMLTAAAVKIAGGGLRNDACNILNEDLYAEAMVEGITFDQYHKWLEKRLERNLEQPVVSSTYLSGAYSLVPQLMRW